MDFPSTFPFSEAIVTLFGIILSAIVFYYQRRRNQIQIIESNFDYLQRINEKALDSDENISAAMRSIRRDEEFTIEEARIYYFNYMRLNRIFRIWIYMERRMIPKKDAMDVIRAGLPSVKEAENYFSNLLARGYPSDFIAFLSKELATTDLPPLIIHIAKDA